MNRSQSSAAPTVESEAPVAKDTPTELPPKGDLSGLKASWKKDLTSGFLVFLIALPLCLGIALASGFPPIAGVFTAIVGGVLTPFISNSELTIKGPAAGLIVIVVGCVAEFGGTGFGDGAWSTGDQNAYQLTLGVAVVAGAIQIVFGLLRGGRLGDFFPLSAVHGMLAAIGVIIISKQVPVALGVQASGSPLQLLAKIPQEFQDMNPEIALIGAVSILIMFLWPTIKQRHIRKVPAPVVVLLVSVPMAMYFGLNDASPHNYNFHGHDYTVSNKYLVNVPSNMFAAVTLPDFSGLTTGRGWYWVFMFAIIGTLESLLSAKAVDLIDPYKRKSNLDRDTTGVGIANVGAAFLGGLPMISEIVRSRANIDNGARTRFANLFHGLFLLISVASIPALISLIPLSALGAMLVYTGFRLAHPREFIHMYAIGPEQLVVFCGTLVAVLATDLLEGIAIGMAIEAVIHLLNGTPVMAFFKAHVTTEQRGDRSVIRVRQGAIFTNWLGLKKNIEGARASRVVELDLSETRFVDHTVMEKLHELEREFVAADRTLVISGLDKHRPLSRHPFAARKRLATRA